ncbi:type II toxin-antitoxin system VapC family toxin [Okeanomitos corallinicola TIOX110]|uniref:Type II toxin-antitoxin system VapC family toxin n=1 Tax=Okeanomitos corallinicola TIOX110 TaxID=3133117 RepID=A0ABZ2UQV3_9CYAN
MSILLLDTNVVSYLFKGDTRAGEYAPILQGNRLAISFITVAELYEWAAIKQWGERRLTQLEAILASYLVIPVDVETCRIWGTIRAQQRAAGTTIASQDGWIAATAIRHTLPLVTHNPSDFQNIPNLRIISVINP